MPGPSSTAGATVASLDSRHTSPPRGHILNHSWFAVCKSEKRTKPPSKSKAHTLKSSPVSAGILAIVGPLGVPPRHSEDVLT